MTEIYYKESKEFGFENCNAQPLEKQGLRGITAQDFLSLDFFYIIIINILTIELVFVLSVSFYKLCKDTFCSTAQTDGQRPNEPKTMNLLERGFEIERSMSQENTNHNRLFISGMNKTNNMSKKSSPRSSPRKICSYIFLLDLYKNYSSLLHSHCSGFSDDPFCKGVHPFYISFLSFILTLHVQIILLIFLILVPSAHS